MPESKTDHYNNGNHTRTIKYTDNDGNPTRIVKQHVTDCIFGEVGASNIQVTTFDSSGNSYTKNK